MDLRFILEYLRKTDDRLWLGAGAVAQITWNGICGNNPLFGVNDLDVFYFDPEGDLDEDDQLEMEMTVDLEMKVDVKNQALVHLWSEEKLGRKQEPFTSLEDAVSQWHTYAVCVAMRIDNNGAMQVIAPHGLEDLITMKIRRNPICGIRDEVWQKKVGRWKTLWPVTVL